MLQYLSSTSKLYVVKIKYRTRASDDLPMTTGCLLRVSIKRTDHQAELVRWRNICQAKVEKTASSWTWPMSIFLSDSRFTYVRHRYCKKVVISNILKSSTKSDFSYCIHQWKKASVLCMCDEFIEVVTHCWKVNLMSFDRFTHFTDPIGRLWWSFKVTP